VAFRNAHHVVGAMVARAEKLKLPLSQVPQKDAEKIHPTLKRDWTCVFDLDRAFRSREGNRYAGT